MNSKLIQEIVILSKIWKLMVKLLKYSSMTIIIFLVLIIRN